jgi:2-(1,2-epoxy-1,2-dihydrophenyl)acetyl-CoA isomerase
LNAAGIAAVTDDKLLTRLDEYGVLTVTFNAPEVKNAIDTRTQTRLLTVLHDACRDPGVRVVVMTGAGNAFCTGADVRTMGAPDPDDPIAQKWAESPIWQDAEARVDRLRHFARASSLLHRMGKPTVAMLRGPAAGLGFSIALACDFRIASRSASLVPAFVRIGMPGDYGGTYFLTKLIGPSRAKEIYMLGDRIDAETAFQLGLFNRLVDDAELEAQTASFARRLASGPPIALRYIKENVEAALDGTLDSTLDMEARNMIRARLTEDAKEAMSAFLEKREPRFKGR